MRLTRPLQRRRQWRRIKQQLHKLTLILDGQAQQVRFLDSALGGILGGSNDKVADTATLQFGCALDDSQCIRGNPCFDTRGALGFCGHHRASLSEVHYTGFYRTFQGSCSKASDAASLYHRLSFARKSSKLAEFGLKLPDFSC